VRKAVSASLKWLRGGSKKGKKGGDSAKTKKKGARQPEKKNGIETAAWDRNVEAEPGRR